MWVGLPLGYGLTIIIVEAERRFIHTLSSLSPWVLGFQVCVDELESALIMCFSRAPTKIGLGYDRCNIIYLVKLLVYFGPVVVECGNVWDIVMRQFWPNDNNINKKGDKSHAMLTLGLYPKFSGAIVLYQGVPQTPWLSTPTEFLWVGKSACRSLSINPGSRYLPSLNTLTQPITNAYHSLSASIHGLSTNLSCKSTALRQPQAVLPQYDMFYWKTYLPSDWSRSTTTWITTFSTHHNIVSLLVNHKCVFHFRESFSFACRSETEVESETCVCVSIWQIEARWKSGQEHIRRGGAAQTTTATT